MFITDNIPIPVSYTHLDVYKRQDLAITQSRYYIAILVENRKSENVTLAIINALKDFPKALVKTITFDRGKELSLIHICDNK